MTVVLHGRLVRDPVTVPAADLLPVWITVDGGGGRQRCVVVREPLASLTAQLRAGDEVVVVGDARVYGVGVSMVFRPVVVDEGTEGPF